MNKLVCSELTLKGAHLRTEKAHNLFQLTRVFVEESCKTPVSLISLLPEIGLKHWHIKHSISQGI